MSTDNRPLDLVALAERFIAEYNRAYPDWVLTVHAENFEWNELPVYGVYPGHTGNRDDLRKVGINTLKLFPDRQMRLLSVVPGDRRVAMEIEWTGTPSEDTDNFKAGEKLRLRQGTFLDFDDEGKVTREVDYTIRLS